MLPILLIHGYSSEGKDTPIDDNSSEGKDRTIDDIYGSLPKDLKAKFGDNTVIEIDLSRWISLNDGISINDISFAMDRALRNQHAELLKSGFNVIIHSTGALIVRNWIKNFGTKPSPINNLIHLAGANFGSGLAHIGQGQLARWGRQLLGTGRGTQVLNGLEFGSSDTIDMHLHYLQPGNSMYHDYEVQEFCMIGSQTLGFLRPIPIRYVKEDSADNTVRTSAGNLNFNYITIKANSAAHDLSFVELKNIIITRLEDKHVDDKYYGYDAQHLSANRESIPFSVIYETAHFGSDIGIVFGNNNRLEVLSLIKIALETPHNIEAYRNTQLQFFYNHQRTFIDAANLEFSILEWNKQEQYEAHAQVIFRLRDQYANDVEHFDITFKSHDNGGEKLESMVEDKHINRLNKGTITFYFRTQKFIKKKYYEVHKQNSWYDKLSNIAPIHVEITGYEPLSGDISYLPMNIHLDSDQLRSIIQSFKTTIIDVELVRLPSKDVFAIQKDKPD